MNQLPKIVADTNIFISAALAVLIKDKQKRLASPSYVLMTKITTREVIAVASSQTLYELAGVLAYPQLKLAEDFIVKYTERIADAVDIVSIRGLNMGCRDPRDDIFIETAYNGRVDALVTRDKDLQDWRTLHTLEKRGCQVIDVTPFLASLDSCKSPL
jgi:putative PIN family toxin of toxin-antitoxin system